MADDLLSIGLRIGGVAHGFAPAGADVAAGFHLIRTKQVHGAALAWVDERSVSPFGEFDALATDRRGVAVAIATADCVPMLVAAPGGRAVAAVHAGWRGLLGGIVGESALAVAGRAAVPPAELRVALGPSIDGCCFEVEREIAARFADRFGEQVWQAWRDGGRDRAPGKGTLDLRRVARMVLRDTGVADEAIEYVGPCTFCGDSGFASYRRDGANAGRQLSWIAIEA
ncbi:MAG: polyphenol oxidase family protein [Alphaproteobacteria bacterium]